MAAPEHSEAAGTGLGLVPGHHHYRAFVGPPEDYDVIGALQFTALFALGLREGHRVADIGCGSLRAGRLLIPYLRPDHYFGIEPERWLVADGLERELGAGVVEAKSPTFAYRDDFDLSGFGVEFDFILAQSIFSHTYEDLASRALTKLAASLAPSGILLVNYLGHGNAARRGEGSGWEYPRCVRYDWSEFAELLDGVGLEGVRLAWPHPRLTWVIAGHRGNVNLRRKAREARWNLGSNLQHPALLSLKRRIRGGAGEVLPDRAKRALRAGVVAGRKRWRAN